MKNKKRIIIAAISLAILAVIGVVIVQAFLFIQKSVQNDIIPAEVSCRVDEVFATSSKNVKETVTVANTGTYDAYIRVIAVTYWQDSKGNVVERQSKDLNLSSIVDTNNWFIGADNVIYYKKPVASGASTADLLANGKSITVTKEANTEEDYEIFEYYQVVEFIAEAIQTNPTTAVTSSWGVTLNSDGTIRTVPTSSN